MFWLRNEKLIFCHTLLTKDLKIFAISCSNILQYITLGRRQSKMLSTIEDKKSIETVFSIADTLATNDNQKHCFYQFLSTFLDGIGVFDCRLPSAHLELCAYLSPIWSQFNSLFSILQCLDVALSLHVSCRSVTVEDSTGVQGQGFCVQPQSLSDIILAHSFISLGFKLFRLKCKFFRAMIDKTILALSWLTESSV